MQPLSRRQSTNFTSAPVWVMASAVAMNVQGVVITSSPGPMSMAERAMWSAAVPLASPTQYFVPTCFA